MKQYFSYKNQVKMKQSRRDFVKDTAKLASAMAVFGSPSVINSFSVKNKSIKKLQVFIPMPIQVVIDDVGWWSGEDGSKQQEPYRTGINRNHVPADYQAIVELGKSLGIRPQAATILCEWDKENILSQIPTSTWMGEKWNNSKNVGPWMEEAAEIIRNNQDHYELTLHGVGHEYWENGIFTRAEWTDSNGQMRPADQVKKHLDYYQKLMEQHSLGPFPKSFVPAAFRHSYGPSEGRAISLAGLLQQKGINYINTPFESMYNSNRVQYSLFGLDDGVMTVDRGSDEFQWTAFPGNPSKKLTGPTCGMHWPNLLHPDPDRNSEVVQNWVDYLKPYNENKETLLAPDSVVFQHQIMHHVLTNIKAKENVISLDFVETDKLPANFSKDKLTIKVYCSQPIQFTSNQLEIVSDPLQREDGIIYKLDLKRIGRQKKAEILVD